MEGSGGGSHRGTSMRCVRIRYDSGESIVGEARAEIVIDENICLGGGCKRQLVEVVDDTYWFDVTVYDIYRVKIL